MAAKKPAPKPRNPISRKVPNTFTAVTDRTLPKPRDVRGGAEPDRKTQDQRRAMEAKPTGASYGSLNVHPSWATNRPATDANAPRLSPEMEQAEADGRKASVKREAAARGASQSNPLDAPVGYRKPEGMDSAAFAWLTGGHHVFEPASGPAINEPHQADPGVTVQRRAEDTTPVEHAKGKAALVAMGHPANGPVDSLVDVQTRNLHRVLAEHAAAGTLESASQKFYGGKTSTVTSPELQGTHDSGVLAATNRFQQAVGHVMGHEGFQAATARLEPHGQAVLAQHIAASAVADTSPNNKYREGAKWPNIEQAEEAASASFEGRKGKFVAGRIQNVEKATDRVDQLTAGTAKVTDFGDPVTSAKTIAFRGALNNKDAADAYRVTDVMEMGQMAPWLHTGKSKMYEVNDEHGERVGGKIALYPDEAKESLPQGATPVMKIPDGAKKPKHEAGNSRAEDAVDKGKPYVHGLNDYAGRRALAGAGLSRGPNYADRTSEFQAATWGSQQVKRTDVTVSHADQYPVVRDWAAEGHADLNEAGQRLFGSVAPSSTQPAWRTNPNTSVSAGDPLRRQPYVATPGQQAPAKRVAPSRRKK